MGTAERSWSRGRVALVGGTAFCVSLLAGQGSAIAMAGAFILAGELHRAAGDYEAAFSRYQGQLDAFVRRKQRSTLKFAGTFAPKSQFFYGGTKRNHESAENRLDRGFRGPPNQQSVVEVCPAVWIACTHKNMRDRSDTDRERCYLAPALGWPVPNPIDLESPLVDSFCSDCTR